MKNLNVITVLAALLVVGLISCKKQSIPDSEIPLVDIAEALKNPSKIRLSELGGKITYVPLELTDSALVGANPAALCITSKYIFVSNNGMFSNGECMAFDRETGKFIALVGHLGQDPQAYSNPEPVYDCHSGRVTFPGNLKNLVTYSPDGKFVGDIDVPLSASNIDSYIFNENNIILYDGAAFDTSRPANILRLSSNGEMLDSLNLYEPAYKEMNKDDVVNQMGVRNSIGTIPGIVLMTTYNNQMVEFKYRHFRWLWNFKDDARFYDNLRDTIYNIEENMFVPKYAVNVGEFPHKDYGDGKIMAEMPVIRTFFETDGLMLFYGNAGILTGEFFAGIFDKQTGETKAGMITSGAFKFQGFENDIDGFMPMLPVALSEKDEFAAMLTVEDVQNWIEEHPEYEFPENIVRIKDLPEDSNPVIAIISK